MLPRRVLAARPLTRALTPTSINRPFSFTSRLQSPIDPEITDPGQVPPLFSISKYPPTNTSYRTAVTSTLLPRNVPSATHMPTGGTSKNDETMANLSTKTTIPSVSSPQKFIHGPHPATASNCRVPSLQLYYVSWEPCT